MTNVFEVLQKVGDGFTLAVGQHRLVETIAGFACVVKSVSWLRKLHDGRGTRRLTSAAGTANTHGQGRRRRCWKFGDSVFAKMAAEVDVETSSALLYLTNRECFEQTWMARVRYCDEILSPKT